MNGELKILGLGPRMRLRLWRIRLNAHAFCWVARWCPPLAEAWALRGGGPTAGGMR